MSYLSEPEIEALQPPPNMSVVEWVESHRILPKGSAEPGPKRISRTPNLRAVYEWFNDYHIKEITCQKPAQCGFTDLIVDLILWICENDPSPTALFLADQDTARKIMKFRIIPALKGMGKLSNDVNNKTKSATKFECSLTNGFYLMVSWGSSISQTASMSFKYVFCDEINKPGYDANKSEGNALGRIRERMETFPDSKFIKFSTPTIDTGNVTKELEKADVIFDYQIPCPECGGFNRLNFKNVVWEGGHKATRAQIESTARYICEHCGHAMDTTAKNKAVEKGLVIARAEVENPRHVGLQLHRLSSLFKGGRLDEMIDRWCKAQEEGPSEIQNVVNSVFGEAWVNRTSAPESERMGLLRRCIADFDKLYPPAETIAITAGVDVQQDGFWYRLRAWADDLTSWGIDEGFAASWDDLLGILTATYDGKRVWRCLIDTGGTKEKGALISRTEETYNFIRANKGVINIMGAKGSSVSMPNRVKIGSPIDKTPSGKPIPGGIRIAQINTGVFKDLLWWRVEKAVNGEPGGFYFHNATQDYVLKQLLAEEKRINKDGSEVWEAIGKRDNHLLDCEVYAMAAVDAEFFGGIRAARAAINQQIKHEQPKRSDEEPVIRHERRVRGPNPYTEGIY